MATDHQAPHPQPKQLTRARFSGALSYLYFARTAISLLWVLAMSGSAVSADAASGPGLLLWTLLVVYPLTDAAATVADIRRTPRESQTIFQRLNLATSLAATGGIALVGILGHDIADAIEAYGLWAIISGVIQLIVALRRNTIISAQWFMIISGAGSVFAGFTFLSWGGSTHDGITTLVQYSTGGALWYAIAATWLLVSAHRRSHRAADTSLPVTALATTQPP